MTKEDKKINIFEYDNYRSYLRDYYHYRKGSIAGFSYRSFARKAGLKTANYLKQVIDGKRPITDKNLTSFIKGLDLKGDEARYFRALVNLDRAITLSEKEGALKKVHNIKKKQFKSAVGKKHYSLFSSWYTWAIRELVLLSDFEPTPEYIAKRLNSRITASKAKKCFNDLVELGYLTEDNGRWRQTDPLLTTTDEIASPHLRKVHQEMLRLGMHSIISDPVHEREASGLTVAIPKEKLPILKQKIKEFRRELNVLLTEDVEADDVLQINVFAFKLTGGSR